eukprot:825847-Prymnesium_polylepis.1
MRGATRPPGCDSAPGRPACHRQSSARGPGPSGCSTGCGYGCGAPFRWPPRTEARHTCNPDGPTLVP